MRQGYDWESTGEFKTEYEVSDYLRDSWHQSPTDLAEQLIEGIDLTDDCPKCSEEFKGTLTVNLRRDNGKNWYCRSTFSVGRTIVCEGVPKQRSIP